MSLEEEVLFCSLLQAGSLQSFTDLFYLAKRQAPGEAAESLATLKAIAQSLSDGEAARAAGDTSKLLHSLMSIGERYSGDGKFGSALMFFNRALDLARSSSDTDAELQCLEDLGKCEESMGNILAACAHHETRRAMALAKGKVEAVASAAAAIMRLRERQAEAAEASDDFRGSLTAMEMALDSAKQAGIPEGEARLSYSVGRSLILCGDAQAAIVHLQNYVRANCLPCPPLASSLPPTLHSPTHPHLQQQQQPLQLL